ncbi:MAG: HAD-IIIC family phosphatase [Tannerella sp.]|jgi:FkbH-like protein|nr:HAD-IIIC family phosphatase [Tannerella sp.]
MKYFIFRNHTIEPFFDAAGTTFSGYGDISVIEEADRYVWFYLPDYKTDNQLLSREIRSYLDQLRIVLSRVKPDKLFLVFSMQLIYKVCIETGDSLPDKTVSDYNAALQEISSGYPHVRVLNISDFYAQTNTDELIDWRFYYLSQIPLNPKLAPLFRDWFSNQIRSIELKRKKCIVLDLDNTLWGGILGEDGVNGIQLGETYPGSAYSFFQRFLLDLHEKGVLLTVCSKNNEQEVLDALEQNPYMILKKEHFVTHRINWNNKADNIKEIAEELNIGLDSLVFIDDNPAERELVKQMIPLVEVPDFPGQPYRYPLFAQSLADHYFSIYALTDDDRLKNRQYRENASRSQLKERFSDLNDYIKSLEIELSFEPLSGSNIARLAQLTQKTNQFNLTAKRYVETDLRSLESEGASIYGMRVKDKFGDYGLTGLIIVNIKDKTAEIDTFLLSCRILGKDIEYEFAKYVLYKLKSSCMADVHSNYIKTLKNAPARDFYEKLGFTMTEKSETGKKYIFSLEEYTYEKSELYKIKEI